MTRLERKISHAFNVPRALYTANGTSALYLCFFRAKILGKNKIALPSIICPQVVSAALKAGLKIYFCEPNFKDYNSDFKAIKALYKKEKFDILLVAHLYGHLCDERVFDFAKTHKILLIEDSAQTYKVNPKSDFSVLSFGHTKFLSNAGGGGIVSFKHNLSPLKALNKELLPRPFNLNELFDEYKKTYYALNPLDKNYLNELKNLFLKYCFIFKDERKNELLSAKLTSLYKISKQRKQKAKLYQKLLKHKLIKQPEIQKGSIAWRYTFRMKNFRDELLQALRAKGIDCSSWYMNNEKIFGFKISPKSARLEKEIVNLWCDESISKKQIKQNIKIILAIISQLKGQK